MRTSHALLALVMFLSAACTTISPAATPITRIEAEQKAESTLREFFDFLNNGRYTQAVMLYGGPYDTMRDHNPSIPPTDLAALMRNACTINGAMCLKASTIRHEQSASPGMFLFQVEFENEDGSLFVRGPCCGASPTDQPPQSLFPYTVERTAEGLFLVTDMPPYAP